MNLQYINYRYGKYLFIDNKYKTVKDEIFVISWINEDKYL
jgi:hypothetical protein